jgi:hypothetical protein
MLRAHWPIVVVFVLALGGVVPQIVAAPGPAATIGGLVAAAVLTPPCFLLDLPSPVGRWCAAGAVADGIGVAWLGLILAGPLTVGQWLGCYVVLIAFVAAAAAVAVVLMAMRVNRVIAAGVAMFLAIAELTWPVWLSPQFERLSESTIDKLVELHPVFALCGLAPGLGDWTHQNVAYQLTSLGQDVLYALPQSIWPTVLTHLCLAGLLICGAWLIGRPLAAPARPGA